MRWYLIGFMGVGKSTHGRNLAHDLDLPFLDLDKEIVKKVGTSIEDIFKDRGEPYFRKVEYDVLISVSKRFDQAVISTGGGLPCQGRNMDILNALGKTLYLRSDATALANRLSASKSVRPLLAGKNYLELKEYIDHLLAKRDPIYRQAEVIVDLDLTQEIEVNRKKILAATQPH